MAERFHARGWGCCCLKLLDLRSSVWPVMGYSFRYRGCLLRCWESHSRFSALCELPEIQRQQPTQIVIGHSTSYSFALLLRPQPKVGCQHTSRDSRAGLARWAIDLVFWRAERDVRTTDSLLKPRGSSAQQRRCLSCGTTWCSPCKHCA